MSGRKVWVADEVLSADDLNGYLMDQIVGIFANSTARDSAMLTPIEGQMVYLQDTNIYQTWNGSAWVEQNTLGGNAPTATNASKVGGITIFNSSSTPTANATGDLWFY